MPRPLEQILKTNAKRRADTAERSLAAGRVPGRIGRTPLEPTPERMAIWEAQAEDRQRKTSKAAIRRRSAVRAQRALADGRVPGRPGPKRTLVTKEQRMQNARERAMRYLNKNREAVRATQAAKSGARWAKLRTEDPVRYKIICAANSASCRVRSGGLRSPRGLTAIVQRIWDGQGGVCAVCPSTHDLQLDHKLAVANGGDNRESNLSFLCRDCNLSKSDKDFQTWLATRAQPEGMAA